MFKAPKDNEQMVALYIALWTLFLASGGFVALAVAAVL